VSDEKMDELFARIQAARAEAFRHQFDFIRTRCESPIEEQMLAALLHMGEHNDDDSGSWQSWYSKLYKGWPEIPDCHVRGTYLITQAVVGEYRADFLLLYAHPLRRLAKSRFLVIECDGHDYHERTKEQAQRDKERDRWMVTQGITVLRFTGSEIWRDAIRCAREVAEHWEKLKHDSFFDGFEATE
jgi:very-short-patch-repair endonuclease